MDIINVSTINYNIETNSYKANSNHNYINIISPITSIILTLDSIIINNTMETSMYNVKIVSTNETLFKGKIRPNDFWETNIFPNSIQYIYYQFRKNNMDESIYYFIKK